MNYKLKPGEYVRINASEEIFIDRIGKYMKVFNGGHIIEINGEAYWFFNSEVSSIISKPSYFDL